MSEIGAGVGAQDVGLRVGGAPEGGWRKAHAGGHPELGGGNSYDDDCSHCRLEARMRECADAQTSLDGARRKIEKQRLYLDDALAAEEQYAAELRDARDRVAEAEQEVSRDGVDGE